jgi:hypothetical protein
LAEASPSKTGQMAARCNWRPFGYGLASSRPGTIAQCLNLEHEMHHAASKLRILSFEPLK